jgi:hypothetical protein
MRRETSDFRTEFTITGDEASERKLRDLLAGKSVPTGRIVEVTYRNPDGSTETQRHAEFAQIDKVSYDPAPVIGGREIAAAKVMPVTERIELPPGRSVKEAAYALTPRAEAAIKAFVESVPLTQDAINAGSDALERQIEESFGEPLDAVPDPVEDLQAQAVWRVIRANRLLAEAVEVLGPEAVDLMMHNLAVPELEAAS